VAGGEPVQRPGAAADEQNASRAVVNASPGEVRQASSIAVYDDGGDHVAEHGRLAGAGRPVDGEQPRGVAERPQDLVHRELLAEGKRPIGARDPPTRGNTIRGAACADA
jgi:hypothetical protein